MLEIPEFTKHVSQPPSTLAPHADSTDPCTRSHEKRARLELKNGLWQLGLQMDGGSLSFQNKLIHSKKKPNGKVYILQVLL